MKTPTNIHAVIHGSRVVVEWLLDGARYHVWFDIEDGKLVLGKDSGVIYKNPPTGTTRDDAGYFHTRRLDATSKSNAQIVKHIREAVEDGAMLKAAIVAKAHDERVADAERKQEAVDYRREQFVKLLKEMHEHDRVEMLDSLSDVLSMDDIDGLTARLP